MTLKNKVIISLLLAASGLFLYQGFTLLFHPQELTIQESK